MGHQFSLRNLLAHVVLIVCVSDVCAYKILSILPTSSRSHHIVASALLKELANRGHEVTVISPFPLKNPIKNYYDISTPAVLKVMEASVGNVLELNEKNLISSIFEYYDIMIEKTKVIFETPEVQRLLKSNQTFDIFLCESFLTDAFYGFSEKFNAPLIGFGSFGAISWNNDKVGSPSPPSYIPNVFLPFTERMTLFQRIINLAYLIFERLSLDYYFLPQQEALYKKYFPENKQTMREITRNAALVLLNQHVSLSFARPYMPNHIEVGGMHINRKQNPLPADIQQFLDDAKDGAIYFSLGSNVKSKLLPIEKREAILNTLRNLKQRVLWKFEDSNLPGKPDNVFISDWFPQDDILAHKNVLAFITHGGLLSTTESIYHAKPFIGIPIFGDQFLNMARAEQYGYGLTVPYKQLNEQTFKSAIDRILNDRSYMNSVREVSARFRDQETTPLEHAVFWVEHVARHKGAKYLHCAGLDLNFIQYHNIDAMLILVGSVMLLIALLTLAIRKFYRLVKKIILGDRNEKKLKKH